MLKGAQVRHFAEQGTQLTEPSAGLMSREKPALHTQVVPDFSKLPAVLQVVQLVEDPEQVRHCTSHLEQRVAPVSNKPSRQEQA